MRARDTDAIPLPPSPSVDQYKKRAKALVSACEARAAAAVHDWALGWIESLATHLPAADSRERWIAGEVEHLEREALERGFAGDQGTGCSLADAQLFVAHVHGFDSWPKFAAHLADIARRSPVSDFEAAADAIVTGDIGTLIALLSANPELVRARSTRMHGATLLHYIAANGHEGYRQRTPTNAVEIARLLLDAGAQVDALARMYGGDYTTMEMLVSSTPPAEAGLQVALAETLLDGGAAPDGVKNDSSPIMTALRFHYIHSAEALARRGARVDNTITAAAFGRADLVERFVMDDGTLAPGVPLVQVPWPRVPKDPRKHLAYALSYAALYGRAEVVAIMLRKGVDPNGADDDGPALHWAAATGRMDIARTLLDHGASLEALNTYGGTVLSSTVWFAWNAPVKGVDYASVIDDLIALGARTDFYPELAAHIEDVRRRWRVGQKPSD